MWFPHTNQFRWALAVTFLSSLMYHTDAVCPQRCYCNDHHVRCIAQQLNAIPLVDSDTVVLDLRTNNIRDIPPGSFSNLKSLRTLMLNGNRILIVRAGAFQGLANLQMLYLSKNRIHQVDDDAFRGLPKLKYLYLNFNSIEGFNKEVFSQLPLLERLFLNHNKIRKIPKGAFDGLPRLDRLRLDGNSLVCDCSVIWLMKMIADSSVKAAATCQSPFDMKGLSLTSMLVKDMKCEEPSIENGPKDVEVNFGGTAIFTCKVRGDPLPEVVWMKDSNEIELSDPRYNVFADGTLKIEDPKEDDAGVFECMAKSPLGQMTSNKAKMTIHAPPEEIVLQSSPTFVIRPESKWVKFGDLVLLHCSGKGVPRPYTAWKRNNEGIILGENIKLHKNGSLIIQNVKEKHAGVYKCVLQNIHGKITASADINILASPTASLSKQPDTVVIGGSLMLKCESRGSPPPVITWYKNGFVVQLDERMSTTGNLLQINLVTRQDAGNYLCRAENSQGFKEASVTITVQEKNSTPPFFTYKPFDIETFEGSRIEIPCKSGGDPKPTIFWKKEGSHIEASLRHKISEFGSLYISNVTEADTGRYECSVVNSHGRKTASGYLNVQKRPIDGSFSETAKPGDQFVSIAFAEAQREVDSAINKTMEHLFGSKNAHLDMSDLYRVIRFPSAPAREIARAGEVFERTLVNIRRLVNAGKVVNNTNDFNYKEILSTEYLNLVAKLSGCITHRTKQNCTNLCFHSKYRSIDGTCNNFANPTWGASNVGFRRILKPRYENGFSQPIGWTKEMKYNGFELPSARLVSSKLISTAETTFDSEITHMVMQWGQFLDHDLDHATPSVSSQSWEGVDCKRTCEYAAPCFPIDVPKDDPRVDNRRCIDFTRSSSVCGSGMTSVFFEEVQPREQINQLTSFIDGSQIYGFSQDVARDLRDLSRDDGLLRTGGEFPGRKAFLPFSSSIHEMDCRKGVLDTSVKCYVAGDIRANEQVGLLAMHTLWMREHNRIAEELREMNPHWRGDTIYHEARKIVGAEIQHITYEYWLPIILGPTGSEKLGFYLYYNDTLNPTISNVFATAALRFGHTLINPILHRFNKDFDEIPEGHLPLHKAFFSSWRIEEEGGIDPLLRGLFSVPAKLKTSEQNLNSELTEKLFHVAHAVALDLAAMNIQRGRDHAIPPYTEWRKVCNMSEVNSFDDLKNEITDKAVRENLKQVYGNVHNIDVFVGGILEDQVEGAKVGPLFQCLLIDQFQRLRDGDRFWYENPSVFKPNQLNEISKVTLSAILCDNSDGIDRVTPDVFFLPEVQEGIVDCQTIQRMDLRAWADCSDCEGGLCGVSSPEVISRTRRQVDETESCPKSLDQIKNLQHQVKTFSEMVSQMEKRIEQLENKSDF